MEQHSKSSLKVSWQAIYISHLGADSPIGAVKSVISTKNIADMKHKYHEKRSSRPRKLLMTE